MIRVMGKLNFYDLIAEGTKIQVVCALQDHTAGEAAFEKVNLEYTALPPVSFRSMCN